MKKILILALAVVMAGTMAACGMGDVGGASSGGGASSSSSSQAASSQAASQPSQDSYSDSLDGMEKYLSASQMISGNPSEMKADFIGAVKGVKYSFGLNGSNNISVELYEFNPSSLNDAGKTVINDVKSKGNFTIMNQKVDAVLSDNGKYLMIYKDTVSNNDQNKKHRQDTESLFRSFKK